MAQAYTRKERVCLLYQLYEQPMYRIAYSILHHPEQAEDAVSEAFCYLLRHLDKFDEPESDRTKQYIIRLMHLLLQPSFFEKISKRPVIIIVS